MLLERMLEFEWWTLEPSVGVGEGGRGRRGERGREGERVPVYLEIFGTSDDAEGTSGFEVDGCNALSVSSDLSDTCS